MTAARTKEGWDILKTYWYHHRIWHYVVLNLEVKPWEALIMDTRIKEVFEFHKVAIDAVDEFLNEIRRALRTEALFIHPGERRHAAPRLGLIEWSTKIWERQPTHTYKLANDGVASACP
ncbi:hypothetical protein MRX96_024547 [Rhipicephalus microplus]